MLTIIILVLLVIIVLITLFIVFTPYPSSFLVKKLFEGGVAVKPSNYEAIQRQTLQHENLVYESSFSENRLDVISPKDRNEPLPVILWVHGGAFVAGDKSDITEYAVQLAANGYHVVNMNYALAPSKRYPSPLLQMNDAYAWILKNDKTYNFDTSTILFAGDSAGAQIVSQYALVQTNADYAKQLDIAPVVHRDNIAGLLLYCGPFDIKQLSHLSDNKLVAFLLNRVGWGYIGERNWQSSETTRLASTVDFVTSDYPPSFITDGNVMTFEAHGKALVTKLQQLDVPVVDKFYTSAELPHEYQFMMNTKEAAETFEATLQFLKQVTK